MKSVNKNRMHTQHTAKKAKMMMQVALTAERHESQTISFSNDLNMRREKEEDENISRQLY